MLDFDLFTKVIDEAGPTLGRIDFFNYGEAFLHKRAVEMCEYIKTKFPHIYLYTSTNGLAFTEEKVRQLARSGIDEVTFSLDGSSQEAYVKYRQRGTFEVAKLESATGSRIEITRTQFFMLLEGIDTKSAKLRKHFASNLRPNERDVDPRAVAPDPTARPREFARGDPSSS